MRKHLFVRGVSSDGRFLCNTGLVETQLWYATLIKPAWAPPAWLFSPVWAILYAIIAISFGFVFYKAFRRELPLSVAVPFALNLVFNFAFSPIQFGLQNNLLAAADIVLVLATLIWAFTLRSALREAGLIWVLYANIPYLLWVSFATILQFTITYLNW